MSEDDDQLLKPEEAAKLLKVAKGTLVSWDNQGLVNSVRTKGGHRRYRRSDLFNRISAPTISSEASNSNAKRKFAYCRVSSPKQNQDLEHQIEFFRTHYPHHEIVRDVGSSLFYKRKGLQTLLDLAIRGGVEELVVTHRDQLCRFNFDFIQGLVQQYSNGKVVVLHQREISTDKELADDLVSIVTLFSTHLSGLRSKKLKKELKERALRGRENSGSESEEEKGGSLAAERVSTQGEEVQDS
jgi:excisionase family DNA binding protein